ncbi:MAG: M13 family metallopeptidase [Candidatus Zixiibacteriota bacterium]
MSNRFKTAVSLVALSGAAVLIGCGTQVAETAPLSTTTNVRGIDPKNLDTTCAPCNDFYQYANGTWLKNNPVPKEYGSWGVFHEIHERNNVVLKEILDEVAAMDAAPGTPAQKIGDFYTSGMDTAAINRTGIAPLKADFERIAAISSVTDLCQVISRYHAEGINMLFDTDALEGLTNSSRVNLYATQGGLGLPERDYYTRENEESTTLRAQYVEHMTNMFKLLGDDSATAQSNADVVMALETGLAQSSWTVTDMRNYPAWYRVKTLAQVAELAPDFDWNGYVAALGFYSVDSISFGPEQFFEGMSKLLKEAPLDHWKLYVRWNVIRSFAFYVGEEFDKENFRFYGTILSGAQERRERWKRVLSSINNYLGEAMGQLFVERAFPPESKSRAMEMVNNLKTVLRERLSKLEWMSEETRQRALAKMEAFGTKIGYPDKWRDYGGLEIGKVSFVENARAGLRHETAFKLSKVGKAPDPTEWGMTPQTVNAYYNPVKNEIVFPAGILQPPYFDGEIDDAINYGAMGVVIGHEMLHGFDDSGSRFDADGNMVNWWTDEDRQKFEERTAKLVAQFDAYVAIDSLHVRGALTLGENIGDLGGLRVAYDALQLARQGKADPMVNGFTQNQRFFFSFAQVWRSNATPENIKLQVQSDPHSPDRFRVLGPLSNMDEFQAAFGCSDTDPMMRPPAERIRIW